MLNDEENLSEYNKNEMKIWVDADACPAAIKELLYKRATKEDIPLILVANSRLQIPRSRCITFCLVHKGLDVADNEIIRQLQAGDIVITADIPLAARAVEQGALVISPRGDVYTEDNIQERLSVRNFLETLRSSGIETGGPASFTARDKQAFAKSLDMLLARKRAPR